MRHGVTGQTNGSNVVRQQPLPFLFFSLFPFVTSIGLPMTACGYAAAIVASDFSLERGLFLLIMFALLLVLPFPCREKNDLAHSVL